MDDKEYQLEVLKRLDAILEALEDLKLVIDLDFRHLIMLQPRAGYGQQNKTSV